MLSSSTAPVSIRGAAMDAVTSKIDWIVNSHASEQEDRVTSSGFHDSVTLPPGSLWSVGEVDASRPSSAAAHRASTFKMQPQRRSSSNNNESSDGISGLNRSSDDGDGGTVPFSATPTSGPRRPGTASSSRATVSITSSMSHEEQARLCGSLAKYSQLVGIRGVGGSQRSAGTHKHRLARRSNGGSVARNMGA